ncbi:hypothetical protein ACFO3A_10005 [Comamonas nitrativorans]|uniref:Transposase n=1 Tax=Comamonas nitrativorans TaxID=108437 RepID=A0ABV9GX02_9BURK
MKASNIQRQKAQEAILLFKLRLHRPPYPPQLTIAGVMTLRTFCKRSPGLSVLSFAPPTHAQPPAAGMFIKNFNTSRGNP